jgi:hypothetical protein
MDWIFENGRIYSIDENKELLAEATFTYKTNGDVVIDHTWVSPLLRGKGVAGIMMEAVAGYLREHSLKASATCSYANAWLKKNKASYSDILSQDFDDEATACKIGGKH